MCFKEYLITLPYQCRVQKKVSHQCVFCCLVDAHNCLRAHNEKRALHGAQPLRWDWSLARDAETWALELANTNTFKHAPWQGQGENLYSITRVENEPISCEDAVEAW